jgi:hypothetical protein
MESESSRFRKAISVSPARLSSIFGSAMEETMRDAKASAMTRINCDQRTLGSRARLAQPAPSRGLIGAATASVGEDLGKPWPRAGDVSRPLLVGRRSGSMRHRRKEHEPGSTSIFFSSDLGSVTARTPLVNLALTARRQNRRGSERPLPRLPSAAVPPSRTCGDTARQFGVFPPGSPRDRGD